MFVMSGYQISNRTQQINIVSEIAFTIYFLLTDETLNENYIS